MPLQPQPWIEWPNLRASIALIVDDPAPCINPLWYFRHQVDRQPTPVYERTIPLSFMEEWCRWVGEAGIRGDFTILPYPAGLGHVDKGLEGYDAGEVREWIRLARSVIAPQFDIHAEILTHTNALDLGTGRLLPISEHDWMAAQDEDRLADYFAAAMQILGEAGVPNHGITQPCYFRGDEARYACALLAAEKRVNQRAVTHYFLHMDSVAPAVPPRVSSIDEAAGEAVVSVWAGTDDEIWNTQEPGHADGALSPNVLADRFLTPDGHGGRLPELLRAGLAVLVTHWQSLYSNGTGLGLRVYQELVARVAAVYGDQVAWGKLSEITHQHLAATTARLEAKATQDTVEVLAVSPFTTDILTITIPMPWPLYRAPLVWIDGEPATQAVDAAHLQAHHWLMRGSLVTVSLPLTAGQTTKITIRAVPQ